MHRRRFLPALDTLLVADRHIGHLFGKFAIDLGLRPVLRPVLRFVRFVVRDTARAFRFLANNR
jgi:hypothetical protein